MDSQTAQPGGAEVLGRRVAAGFLDIAVLFAAVFAVALATNNLHTDHGVQAELHGLAAVAWLVLAFAYYWLFEAANGQTPGKRLLSIKVVDTAGDAPGAGRAAGRTILRVIDVLPFFYLLGFVIVLVTRRRAGRLGDLAAGTSVVQA